MAYVLDQAYGFSHDGRFVQLGKGNVHVENIRILLRKYKVQHTICTARAQRVCERVFAAGVDLLADDARPFERHRLPRAAYGGRHRTGRGQGQAFDRAVNRGYVSRRSPAAAAYIARARLDEFRRHFRKDFRADIVYGRAVFRQSRVRLHNQRQVGVPRHLLDHGINLHRAERAVDADRACAERGERDRGARHGNAGKSLAAFRKGHGAENGQGSVFTGGEQPGLELEQIGKGFEYDEIRAMAFSGDHRLAEQLIGAVKGERAHGLEHLAERAEVQRDFYVVSTFRCNRRLCVPDRRADQMVHSIIAAAQFVSVYAERVRINIIRAGADIFAVNIRQDIRVGDVDRFRQCSRHVDTACEHGSHTSVKQKTSVLHLRIHPFRSFVVYIVSDLGLKINIK